MNDKQNRTRNAMIDQHIIGDATELFHGARRKQRTMISTLQIIPVRTASFIAVTPMLAAALQAQEETIITLGGFQLWCRKDRGNLLQDPILGTIAEGMSHRV